MSFAYQLKLLFRKTRFSWLGPVLLASTLLSCTNNSALFSADDKYIFEGLSNVDIENDGALILSWDKPPSEGLNYFIYRREVPKAFDWTRFLETTSGNSYKHPAYAIDKKYCFAVRYVRADLVPDTNTKEVCPDLGYVKDFEGIVSATATGVGGVLVTWKLPETATGLNGFGIYEGTNFENLRASAGPTDTSLTVTGFSVDSYVTIGVRALDKYGRSDTNTRTITLKIVNNSPLTFKGIEKVTQSSPTSVVVDWPTPAGIANEFRIFRWSGAPGDTPVVDFNSPATTAAGTLNQTTISNLGDEQKHCFGVRSVSSGSQEDLNTATQCLTFPDNGAPVFAGLQTTQFSGGAAVLNWNAAVGETAKYRVYYQEGTSLNFSTATMVEVAAPAVTHSLTGLPDNRSWTFAVRAVDSRNQIDSNTVTRTSFAGDLTAPSFLGYAGAELVADSETQLTVTFNRSTDIDMSHYSIRGRLTGSGATFMELTTITQQGAGPISKTIPSLLPATSYDILVKAVDTSGNPSTNTSFKTRATLDQTPPTFNGITSVGATPGDISKTRVQWNAATDAGGIKEYRVYYSTQSLVGKTLVRTATYPLNVSGQIINMSTAITSGTQADIMALTENTNYYFVVHAIDNADNEDTNTSQQQYTVPFYTPPAAPTGLAFAGGAGPSSDRYPFVTGTSIAGYKVKLYVDDVAVSTTAINTSGAFSIQLSLANTTGNYVVKAAHLNPSDVEGVSDTVGTYQLVVDTPVATITGAPTESSMSNATALNVTVGGSNVTQYKFAMLTQATACNATINNYSVTWTDVATPITASTGADGAKRLCVIAKNSGGFEQDITAATERNWTKNTTPPAAPTITAVSDPVTNSTSETYNGVVTVTVNSVAAATHYCAKGNTSEPAAPAAGDSCWTASTTLAAALTGSGGTTTANTIYAWSKDSASNISTSASTSAGTIDYVNICSSGTLATTCTVSTSRTLAAGGATIGGQGSLVMASGGSLNGGAGERNTITLLGNLTVQNGGVINANVDVTAVNLNLISGGIIKADGLGFASTTTNSGNGPGGGLAAGVGGGYGGAGATFSGNAGGPTYGSPSEPTAFGSSGAGSGTVAGGHGGGAIKLSLSGTATLDGTISANGTNVAAPNVGGGSGGSIWVNVVGNLSGLGSLSAKALTSAANCHPSSCGAGGGGRVSISGATAFGGTVDVAGGALYNYAAAAGRGEPGTLHTNYGTICSSGTLNTTCNVTAAIVLGDGVSIAGTGNLVIANGGALRNLKNLSSISIAMGGSVTVQNGASIQANLSNLSAANITVDAGGSINADGLGFLPMYVGNSTGGTSPGGIAGSTTGAGGGSHGGLGGNADTATGIGGVRMGGATTYGSRSAPLTFGSAGGGLNQAFAVIGGAGGGAVRLTVAAGGTLTVNGTISANGLAGNNNSTSHSTGGGAGGSVYLDTPTIAGTGTVEVKGGAGGTAGTGKASGGGGGGRLALTSSNRFTGTFNVEGGTAGSGATTGYPGSTHFTNPDNYCSSGALSSGTCTISTVWRLEGGDVFSGVNLVVASGGSLQAHPTEKIEISMTGDITFNSGSSLKANSELSANNVTIAAGASINLDGLGYQSAAGQVNGNGPSPGNGGVGGSNNHMGAGGGAHGGNGGNGGGSGGGVGIGGTAYGSATDPLYMGSAGGGSGISVVAGGAGGGYIFIDASATVSVLGSVSANGATGINGGSSGGGGGGAGGGIKIIANEISGAGLISANGGNGGNGSGGSSRGGGGGGGGIIYLSANTISHSGSRAATGGTGGSLSGTAGSTGLVTP